MKIKESTLRNLVKHIGETQTEEMGCGDCAQELDGYVDMLRQGESPDVIKPLVKHHLDMCENCHEEFTALLNALEEIEHDE